MSLENEFYFTLNLCRAFLDQELKTLKFKDQAWNFDSYGNGTPKRTTGSGTVAES